MEFTLNLISECGIFYQAKGLSPFTISDIVSDIKKFWQYCQVKKIRMIGEITLKVLHEYTIVLQKTKINKCSRYNGENKFLSPSTVAHRIVSVKNLIKFCRVVYDEGIDPTRIQLPKIPKVPMQWLTTDEISNLIEHIKKGNETEENKLRHILFIKLAFVSGMRLSELLSIKVEDVLKDGFEILIIGKGHKPRPVYINQEIKDLAIQYVQYRREKTLFSKRTGRIRVMQGSGELLFIRHDDAGFGGGLSKSTIVGVFQKYSDEMGVRRITAHMLRHSCGTYLLDKGIDIRFIQEILGHTSILTTQGYTHVTNSQLRKIHEKVFH